MSTTAATPPTATTTSTTSATADNDQKQSKARWFPLESNPELLNGYLQKLGYQGGPQLVDVLSTEDWALAMVPQPVHAVIFLYPLTEKQVQASAIADAALDASTAPCWYMKQRIGNACGTIALLHSLLNLPAPLRQTAFRPDSWLARCAAATADMTPIQRAEYVEGDTTIAALHDQTTSSTENATGRGNLEDKVETHFIVFLSHDNTLIELDGRKPQGPIVHGPCVPEVLLHEACGRVIPEFMRRDPEEVRFTILALAGE